MTRQESELAILFADITGSTRLFKTVGDVIARVIERDWQMQVRELLQKYEGRLVKTIGDEVMCAFQTVDTAVLAASAMQSAVMANPPAGYEISLHMGLHYGKVITENGDIFGNTVNVAAYLTNLATPQQVLIDSSTFELLPDYLKMMARPIYHTVLKGHVEDIVVYELLWKTDNADLTHSAFSSRVHPCAPRDEGGLILRQGEKILHLNHLNPTAKMGRSVENDIVALHSTVSRHHARIELSGMNFYLVDQSINGTFVTVGDLPEVDMLHRSLLLDGSGIISMGCSYKEAPDDAIFFSRDRRSLFRV